MKSFISKFNPFKSKKVRSPLDISDFMVFAQPKAFEMQQFISKRFDAADQLSQEEISSSGSNGEAGGVSGSSGGGGSGRNTGIYGDPTKMSPEDILISKKRMFFDLRYRCGTAGRCLVAEGKVECKFPECFHCRPITKGGHIFEERMQFELGNDDHPVLGPIVKNCSEDNLELAIEELDNVIQKLENETKAPIQKLVEKQAKTGGSAAKVISAQEAVNMMHKKASAAREAAASGSSGPQAEADDGELFITEDGRAFGVPKIDELIAMSLWRATLLVNVTQEEKAVQSLLRLTKLLPKEYRPVALSAAASWASYSDMELRFFQAYTSVFPDFVPANPSALTKKPLLPVVVEACTSVGAGNAEHAEFYLDHVVNTIFGLEIQTILSRAQAAQLNGDSSEDPIQSPVVEDSIHFYRKSIGGKFWLKFFSLCSMPPLPPPEGFSSNPQAAMSGYTAPGTPRHLLDAAARSMLLHSVMKEIEAADVAGEVFLPQVETPKASPSNTPSSANRGREFSPSDFGSRPPPPPGGSPTTTSNSPISAIPPGKEKEAILSLMQELIGVVRAQAEADQAMMKKMGMMGDGGLMGGGGPPPERK